MSAPAPSLIVAMARNRVIGRDNALPWHLPEDLARFRTVTMGHHIVMGRRTFESIGRLLPGRTTVVVTRNRGYVLPGAIVTHSLAEALAACAGDAEPFVVGGGELFAASLPLARRIHLTTVEAEVEGDVVMPAIDRRDWATVHREHHPAHDGQPLAWTYEVLDRYTR
jgi:dihydrofolate reductase